MAIQDIKNEINLYIKTNNNEEITGNVMNGVLNDMVDALHTDRLEQEGAVRYDAAQSLTNAQKVQARTNINVPSKDEAILKDAEIDFGTSTLNVQNGVIELSSSSDLVINEDFQGQTLTDEIDRLDERIDNVTVSGRFLSGWNCTTGFPVTNPSTSPYPYKSGDFFIVSKVSSTVSANLIPSGTQYVIGTPSSTHFSGTAIGVNDIYRYDGNGAWTFVHLSDKSVNFSSIIGNPYDNTNLANVLDELPTAHSVQYNDDDFSSVVVAYENGKLVYTEVDNHIMFLSNGDYNTTGEFSFYGIDEGDIYYVTLNSDDEWSELQNFTPENTNNKVTSQLNSESSNTEYPSAKLTYDSIHPANQSVTISSSDTSKTVTLIPNRLCVIDATSASASSTLTINLSEPTDSAIENEYKCIINCDIVAPTISFGESNITWNPSEPELEISNFTEFSIIKIGDDYLGYTLNTEKSI